MKYGELYIFARNELLKSEEAQTAGVIARDLVCSLSGKRPEEFLNSKDEEADAGVCRKIKSGLARIHEGEPLAYVLGEWDFYGIRLHVTPDVLIPRDDTCAVADLAIHKALFMDKDPRILDLCCGSGCIGIALASRVKDARVTLADISKEALIVAKKNVAMNKLGGRITCVHSDAFKEPDSFLGKFDMIVSNPPYITSAEMNELPASVKNYEPHLALYGGEDGLDFYRAIVKNYRCVLKPGGFLCFEFGFGQGDDVCRILEENGYTVLNRSNDFNDRERAVIAQL